QRRDKRDVTRDQPLQAALDESASRLEAWLAAEPSSPSQEVERDERAAYTDFSLPPSYFWASLLSHASFSSTGGASQGRTVPPRAPAAIDRPSGLNATHRNPPASARKVSSSCPLAASQAFTAPS